MTTDEHALREFTELMSDPAARQAFVEVKRQAATRAVGRTYEHVRRAVATTPWAILESTYLVVVDILSRRVMGDAFTPEEIEARVNAAARREPASSAGGVAVIGMNGVLIPKADMMSEMSGGTSIQSMRQSFRAALASDEVSAIVLDVDSPGGMVSGVPEFAKEIRKARGTKPIVAVADYLMASGAYWLASQADEIVVSESSQVGSIGVFLEHVDESAKNAKEGVDPTLIYAGKRKTDGNPNEPLSDSARAHLQSIVDDHYQMFTSDVAAGRGVSVKDVRTGYGEGAVLGSSAALEAGMADRSGTVETVVQELLAQARTPIARAEGVAFVDVVPRVEQDRLVADLSDMPALANGESATIGFIEVDETVEPDEHDVPPAQASEEQETPAAEVAIAADAHLTSDQVPASDAAIEEAKLRARLERLKAGHSE